MARCANEAGEDSRSVARMSVRLAGVPANVLGITLNRLCPSGLMQGYAARSIIAADADPVIASWVESMSRAPFVQSKARTPRRGGQRSAT